jgi:hypothetical protein
METPSAEIQDSHEQRHAALPIMIAGLPEPLDIGVGPLEVRRC